MFSMLLCPSLAAADPLDGIEVFWQKRFEKAAVEGCYHYHCRITQKVVAENAELVAGSALAPIQYDIEVARLGHAHSIRVESDKQSHPWREVFDGDWKYASQDDSDWSVQSLADVLGLSTTTPPIWSIGSGFTPAVFNLSRDLSSGRFRLLKIHENEVDLINVNGETLTLSKKHDYAIARRSWPESALQL